MSIQSTVLNFFLKKFVKNTKPSPDKKPKVDPWNPPKPKISPRPKA